MKPTQDAGYVVKLLLTPTEAAQALGVDRSTVYALFSSGQLASVHIGRARRVPLAEIERFTCPPEGLWRASW